MPRLGYLALCFIKVKPLVDWFLGCTTFASLGSMICARYPLIIMWLRELWNSATSMTLMAKNWLALFYLVYEVGLSFHLVNGWFCGFLKALLSTWDPTSGLESFTLKLVYHSSFIFAYKRRPCGCIIMLFSSWSIFLALK